METIDRKRVQQSFHRGAADYDQHTPVQQRVVQQLVNQFVADPEGCDGALLDIGCGTGRLLDQLRLALPRVQLTGLDLAPNMLQQAAARLPATVRLVQGDAERLPFADAVFAAVVSSSTLQWLAQLGPCFGEVWRVLQPKGRFVFSLFGQGTLSELQQSWRAAYGASGLAGHDGTHRFHTAQQVRQELLRAGFRDVVIRCEQQRIWYPDVAQLLQAVKRIGAGTARPPRGRGLGWRRVLHAMAAHYTDQFGTAAGVPASYQVIYATGRR